jgi:putative radical SAM enzyme (TIGR03279 family)
MDQKHFCKNKCVFCFIDQLPKGMRESLYFKDDDSRLSFLFGNYITLTNLTEHEIERIIKMHISPINISVHTTNPELRVKMMKNPNAGKVLPLIKKFNDANIKINCQLVLCPEYNDGDELKRTLSDLISLKNVECIAAVPVGLTDHRENLPDLKSFDEITAADVLDIIDHFGEECIKTYGERRVYGSDEFYLLSKREIPDAAYYGDFLQLENGVGLWALLKSEAKDALNDIETKPITRKLSIATGVAAYPLLKEIADNCKEKNPLLDCTVYPIVNDFFGHKITVSGLVTATDIIKQLSGKDLGEELLIPSSMLRAEGDMFLDSVRVEELSEKLNVKITPVDNDGYSLVEKILEASIDG